MHPGSTRTNSGMGELVQHGKTAFLLPIGDVKAFAREFERLAADSGSLSRLRQARV